MTEAASEPSRSNGQDTRLVPANDMALARRDAYSYGPSGYPSAAVEEGDDLAATLHYYLRLVLKRKWVIGGFAIAALILGGVVTLMQTPKYAATTRLQIDLSSAKNR